MDGRIVGPGVLLRDVILPLWLQVNVFGHAVIGSVISFTRRRRTGRTDGSDETFFAVSFQKRTKESRVDAEKEATTANNVSVSYHLFYVCVSVWSYRVAFRYTST